MKLGLTGASGFVGSEVLVQAIGAGHEVVAFSRRPERVVPGAVAMRELKLIGATDVGGLDGVIHLAGESVFAPWTKAKRERILRSRVDSTKSLVDGLAAAQPRPRVLVCASAVGWYGDGGDRVLTEPDGPGAGFLADVCRAWEAEAQKAEELGVRVVRLRIGVVLGREAGAWPLLRTVFSLGLGGRVGDGRQYMPWVRVEDVAGLALTAAADMRYRGPVNATAPIPVTNADFTRTLARTLHRPAFLPVPAFALRLALRDQAQMLLMSLRAQPATAQSLGYKFHWPDLAPALADLS